MPRQSKARPTIDGWGRPFSDTELLAFSQWLGAVCRKCRRFSQTPLGEMRALWESGTVDPETLDPDPLDDATLDRYLEAYRGTWEVERLVREVRDLREQLAKLLG